MKGDKRAEAHHCSPCRNLPEKFVGRTDWIKGNFRRPAKLYVCVSVCQYIRRHTISEKERNPWGKKKITKFIDRDK